MTRIFQKSLIILSLLFIFISSHAQKVNIEEASLVAHNWLENKQKTAYSVQSLEFVDSLSHEKLAIIYRFRIKPLGFVWVSADKLNSPVLAYSFESNGDDLNNNLPAKEFLDLYKSEIADNRDNSLKSGGQHPGWTNLKTGQLKGMQTAESVEPMMEVTWGQGAGYNAFTPDNTPTGCVAVAMVQIMRHWAWPDTCQGLHEYTHGEYGDFAVNLDTVKLDWAAMPMNSPNDNIATLMLYAGIALHMNYAPGGSGASTHRCRTLLRDNFSYSPDRITYQTMSDYGTVKNWTNMVKNELINGRPIIYRGQGSGGHAFNFDGFEGDFFHVNWGWSGSSNGYFIVTSLTPGSHNFSESQGCVKGIYPNTMMMWDRPYNVAALAGDSQVAMAWTSQYHRDLSGYKIYRNGSLVGESTETSYTDITAVNGVLYNYSISSVYETDTADYESDQTQAISAQAAEGFTIPFEQGFADGFNGWEISGTNTGFNWGTANELDMGTDDNNKFIGINSGVAGNNVVVSDYMISNGFDFSGSTHVVLSFDYILRQWQDIDHLYLMYRIFGDNEWIEFHELESTKSYDNWTNFKTYLPDGALTENVQLAFYYTDNGGVGYGAGIDNIKITNIANPGVPDFTCDVEEICLNTAVIFTDHSTGTRNTYSWDFGVGADPRYADTEGPHTVVYKSSGPKTVNLILNGLDEIAKEEVVNIVRPPTARFSKTINHKTVTFRNTSTYATAYMWDFGDGMKVTQEEPSRTYALSGDYVVQLIAINHICKNDTTENLVSIKITNVEDLPLEESVFVYPNPAHEQLNMNLSLANGGKVLYSLISLSGQEIIAKQIEVPAGDYQENINISAVRPGIYYLRIQTDSEVFYQKLILN